METKEQRKKRIIGKYFLKDYLPILNDILNKNVTSNDLQNLIETENFYDQINQDLEPRVSKTIKFSEREVLKDFLIENNINLNKEYVLWVEYARTCGMIIIDLLKDFNFSFPYDSTINGIISFTEKDYAHEILLDFYEENDILYLDMKIYDNVRKKSQDSLLIDINK